MKRHFVLLSALCLYAHAAHGQYLTYDSIELRDRLSDHHALVGLVFPTVNATDPGVAEALTVVTREAIRQRARKSDTGQFGQRWVGFFSTYLPREPLESYTHASAVELARINGFQASVWSEAEPYSYSDSFDGYVIRTTFSYAGVYEDFRRSNSEDLRLENWIVTHDGLEVNVGIPSSRIDLPPFLIDRAVFQNFSDGTICFTASTGGPCRPYVDAGPTKLRSIDASTGRAEFTRFGREGLFTVDFPIELFAPTEASAYVAMFFNYARGHWSNTISEAQRVIEGDESSSIMVRDAHLYAGAAQFRSGHDGTENLKSAKDISPFSPTVSQFIVAASLLKLRAGKITQNEFEAILSDESVFIESDWLERHGLR